MLHLKTGKQIQNVRQGHGQKGQAMYKQAESGNVQESKARIVYFGDCSVTPLPALT